MTQDYEPNRNQKIWGLSDGYDLTKFNFDLSANSGSVTVGEQKGSKRLEIDNASEHTIQGKASSGSIKIMN